MEITNRNAKPVSIIKPSTGWMPIDFRELWRFRELLYFLILRDIKVKYKQTFIGVAWAVLQPLVSMIVFTLFFGRLAGIPSEGMPYPVFSFIGLLPWTYFATALQVGNTSLVGNSQLLSKIYFPRLLLPSSAVFAALLDLLISMAFLFILLAWYGIHPTGRIVWLLFFILISALTALGVVLWLSAVNVKYRDVQYAVPFLVQIWFFMTPVVYPSSLVPESIRFLYGLNPMVAVVEGFRWAIVDKEFPSIVMVIISVLVSLMLLVSGAYYFRRMESEFADVV